MVRTDTQIHTLKLFSFAKLTITCAESIDIR